jgi:hypothetical protein
MSFVFALCCNAHASFAASIRRKLLMQAFAGEVHGSRTPFGIPSKAIKQRSTAVITAFSSHAGLSAGLSMPMESTPTFEGSCGIYRLRPPGANSSRHECGRRGLYRGNPGAGRVCFPQTTRRNGNRNFPVSRAGFLQNKMKFEVVLSVTSGYGASLHLFRSNRLEHYSTPQ